jgi:putative oxidoreductase
MIPVPAFLDRAADMLDRLSGPVLTTFARLVFAGVLLMYFWRAGATKLGDGVFGLFHPSLGAYAQIFPRQMEAVGYDVSQLGLWQTLVVLAGTWAEFLLPALIVIGLFTRLAALGMIGFVAVQSLTDIYGLGVRPEDIGTWFDATSGAVILDQRAFWVLCLAVLVFRGGGPLALDRLAFRNAPSARPVSQPL